METVPVIHLVFPIVLLLKNLFREELPEEFQFPYPIQL